MTDKYEHFALASKVLAVAVSNEYDWTVFVDAVPGRDHDKEAKRVAEYGDKADIPLAKLLFPNYDIEKYRR